MWLARLGVGALLIVMILHTEEMGVVYCTGGLGRESGEEVWGRSLGRRSGEGGLAREAWRGSLGRESGEEPRLVWPRETIKRTLASCISHQIVGYAIDNYLYGYATVVRSMRDLDCQL